MYRPTVQYTDIRPSQKLSEASHVTSQRLAPNSKMLLHVTIWSRSGRGLEINRTTPHPLAHSNSFSIVAQSYVKVQNEKAKARKHRVFDVAGRFDLVLKVDAQRPSLRTLGAFLVLGRKKIARRAGAQRRRRRVSVGASRTHAHLASPPRVVLRSGGVFEDLTHQAKPTDTRHTARHAQG